MQALGSGPVVCMSHGLILDNLSSWFLVSAGSLQASHRVLLWDLRGHGRSDRPATGYDADSMLGDLEGLLETLAPGEPVTLLGSSYGSYLALRYALRHPGRVPRLVLVELPLPPERFRDWEHLLSADLETLRSAVPEDLRRQLASHPRRARKLITTVRQLVHETSLLGDLENEESLDAAALGEMTVPVLLIYGSESNCRPDGEWLAATLPNARLEVVPGSHRVLMEQAPLVRRLIEEFVGARGGEVARHG